MKTKVVPLRIPENVDELAALSAKEQHNDKAAVLRQWIHHGAEAYVVRLVAEGRISVGRAAEILNESVYDIYRIAEANRIELGATEEQSQRALELARQISKADPI